MNDQQQNQPVRTEADDITAWMLTLELARARGDFERAAEAQRELRARGVIVKYGPAQAAKGGSSRG